MAYDEILAQRIRSGLAGEKGCAEKKMFGGIAFLINDKMCCGVQNEQLVARINPADYDQALKQPHVQPMDFTGRPMRGYVYVAPAALPTARSLQTWLDQCMAHVRTLPAKKQSGANRTRNHDLNNRLSRCFISSQYEPAGTPTSPYSVCRVSIDRYLFGCGVMRRYGFTALNPLGNFFFRTSGSVIDGTMITSSPSFQFAGVATL